MPARELDGGRRPLEVKDGEIEVRLRVVRRELDGLAHLVLGAEIPAFAADRDAEIVVRPRVLRLVIDGLRERGQRGVELVRFVINDAEDEPSEPALRLGRDDALDEFFRVVVLLRAVLEQAEIDECRQIARRELEHLEKILSSGIEVVLCKLRQRPVRDLLGFLGSLLFSGLIQFDRRSEAKLRRLRQRRAAEH